MPDPIKKSTKPPGGEDPKPTSTATTFRTIDPKEFESRTKSYQDSAYLYKGYKANKKAASNVGMVRVPAPAKKGSGGVNNNLSKTAKTSLTGEANYFGIIKEKHNKDIAPVGSEVYGFPGDPNTFEFGAYKAPKQKVVLVDKDKVALQAKLKDAGYYQGPLDGDIGEGTKKAIEEYEVRNKQTTPVTPPVQEVKTDEIKKENIETPLPVPPKKEKARNEVKGKVVMNQKNFDSKIKKGYKNYTYKSK
jgi:hypothetical protein